MKASKYLIQGGLLALLLFFIIYNSLGLTSQPPITFQSWESKNSTGGSVFNRIQFNQDVLFQGKLQDVWVLQQSHNGNHTPSHTWDQLIISVDKKNKEATFLQVKPGSIKNYQTAKPIDLKVACLICHTGGPRAIRPHPEMKLSLQENFTLLLWNLKIKSYGKLKAKTAEGLEDQLNLPYPILQTPLKKGICTICHNNYFWGRGELKLQNRNSVQFLTEKKLMPPHWLPLSQKQKNILEKFFRL